jgi:hypothetical protein
MNRRNPSKGGLRKEGPSSRRSQLRFASAGSRDGEGFNSGSGGGVGEVCLLVGSTGAEVFCSLSATGFSLSRVFCRFFRMPASSARNPSTSRLLLRSRVWLIHGRTTAVHRTKRTSRIPIISIWMKNKSSGPGFRGGNSVTFPMFDCLAIIKAAVFWVRHPQSSGAFGGWGGEYVLPRLKNRGNLPLCILR